MLWCVWCRREIGNESAVRFMGMDFCSWVCVDEYVENEDMKNEEVGF